MKRIVVVSISAALIALAWLVGKFVHEYLHPYINGTIERNK